MNELVSIIMPTFNSEMFVARSIQSVLNQTYYQWEFLITDDKSTDNTIQIIESFSDSRIKLFQLDKNSGAAVARNDVRLTSSPIAMPGGGVIVTLN